MTNSPYGAAPDHRIKEIIRLAEARLAAQLSLGLAADQRAMTFASFLATLEAAAVGALVVASSHPGWWAALSIVIGFGIATLLAIVAAQPVDWDIPGYRPGSWLKDIASADTEIDDQAAMAVHYDEMIEDNEKTMKDNARLLRISLWLVIVTLIIAAIVAVATS